MFYGQHAMSPQVTFEVCLETKQRNVKRFRCKGYEVSRPMAGLPPGEVGLLLNFLPAQHTQQPFRTFLCNWWGKSYEL